MPKRWRIRQKISMRERRSDSAKRPPFSGGLFFAPISDTQREQHKNPHPIPSNSLDATARLIYSLQYLSETPLMRDYQAGIQAVFGAHNRVFGCTLRCRSLRSHFPTGRPHAHDSGISSSPLRWNSAPPNPPGGGSGTLRTLSPETPRRRIPGRRIPSR